MFNFWMIDENAAKTLAELVRNTDISVISTRDLDMPDPELSIENRVAVIPIKGVLTKEERGGFMRFLMGGGTSYQGLIERVQAADADPEVDSIKYLVDSPGGEANGIFDAMMAIRESAKPSVAVITGMAASGAYGLASQADKVIASNVADLVGSVGVVQTFWTSENVIDVTSSNAPHKAPDPKTDAGFKAIQEQLDMIEGHFIDGIAEGRNVKPDVVRKDFGRGMTYTADVALRYNMIDSIESEPRAQSTGDVSPKAKTQKPVSGNKTKKQGGKRMSLAALLATDDEARKEHEAAVSAAATKATDDERERACAHLMNIDHSKEIVVKAITEGEPFGMKAQSAYNNAAVKAQVGGARADDNPDDLTTDDGKDKLAGDKKAAAVAAVVDKSLEVSADAGAGIFV